MLLSAHQNIFSCTQSQEKDFECVCRTVYYVNHRCVPCCVGMNYFAHRFGWQSIFFSSPPSKSREARHHKTIFILKSHVTLDAYMDNHKHQKWFLFFFFSSSWASLRNTRHSHSTRPPSQGTMLPAQQGLQKKKKKELQKITWLVQSCAMPQIVAGFVCPPLLSLRFSFVFSMCLMDELNKKSLRTHKKERESVLTVLTVMLVITVRFVGLMCSCVALNQLWSLTVVVFLF